MVFDVICKELLLVVVEPFLQESPLIGVEGGRLGTPSQGSEGGGGRLGAVGGKTGVDEITHTAS